MKFRYHLLIGVATLGILLFVAARPNHPPPRPNPPVGPLPLPSTMSSQDYQKLLYPFLAKRVYQSLGWKRDKKVRDTGPFINNKSYGTHNSVRIFYSPEVITWMKRGRLGAIPDGAMIIKEMFEPPAVRYDSTTGAALDSMVTGWAVMVRDSAGSKDGWYWSFYMPGQAIDSPAAYPFYYPNSDFGIYCVRCHASAANEFTFSALNNIEGYPGEPLTFRVDNSWLPNGGLPVSRRVNIESSEHDHGDMAAHPSLAAPAHTPSSNRFAAFYSSMKPVDADSVQRIPPLTYDHVIVGPGGPEQFVTSDQCLSCHDGQPLNLGPNMFIPTVGSDGINLSPYGEWNWSMMGLAGRDPIFYSQIESELKLQPTHSDSIQNLCFRCHGVMGDRQIAIDHPGTLFKKEMVQITDPHNKYAKYGALARDGISCTVCHQIVDDKGPLDSIFTGNFTVSTPGEFEPATSYIYGPFDKPATLAMATSLGMKPVKSDYIKESRLCGSCHTVYLPVYDSVGTQTGNFFEQATYLEWLNSSFQNEYTPNGDSARSCQNCHMPTRFPDNGTGGQLEFQIANIQDQTYPQADHRAPIDSITVVRRKEFARHTLLGVNQFALEMFRQFDDILGVRKKDYMTGSSFGLPFAIASSDTIAKTKTAKVTLSNVKLGGKGLAATVKVQNLAGHRLPSGVGFRRAFLEFTVTGANGQVLWSSGRTNDVGVILGANGKPLPTEFFEVDPKTGRQQYQPHYQSIESQDQVQIYEELIRNSQGKFTTSFLALADPVKDNRLLPYGWTKNGPPGFKYQVATMPHGNVMNDAGFLDGTGSDVITYNVPAAMVPKNAVVTATLYYQSIPPYYLQDRFSLTPEGKGTQRLFYIASNMVLAGTNIVDWKLRIASATATVS